MPEVSLNTIVDKIILAADIPCFFFLLNTHILEHVLTAFNKDRLCSSFLPRGNAIIKNCLIWFDSNTQ